MARITDSTAVALYDSVRMQAFGPIFESEAHAEDFLTWLGDVQRPQLRAVAAKGTRWADPGAYSQAGLNAAYDAWREERCDADGFLLLNTDNGGPE